MKIFLERELAPRCDLEKAGGVMPNLWQGTCFYGGQWTWEADMSNIRCLIQLDLRDTKMDFAIPPPKKLPQEGEEK